MNNLITRYLDRRRYSAAWAAYDLAQQRNYRENWWVRQLTHNKKFRARMRQAASLQQCGFRL